LKLSVIVVVAEYGTAEPTEPRQCTPAARRRRPSRSGTRQM